MSMFVCKAQAQLYFKDPNSVLHYRINLETKLLLKENLSGEWSQIGKLEFDNIELRDIPHSISLESFNYHGQILLCLEGSGQVYLVNLHRLSFKRIDNTFYRGYNFGAIRFIRNNILYSFGGNGFWHANNIESYFSFKSFEWELINSISDSNPNRIKSDYGGYDFKRDIISVIEFPALHFNSQDYHKYRYFEKKPLDARWVYKGNLNIELLQELGVNNFQSLYFNGFFLFINKSHYILGDPQKNKIYYVDRILPFINPNHELSEIKGILFSYSKNNNPSNNYSKIKIDSISFQQLIALGKYKGEFYVKPVSPILYQIGACLVVLILGFLLGFWIKKSRKINSLSSSADSEFSILDGLPEGAYEFLRASLLSPQGHEFSSQAFTELMGFSNYAYETQRQVRSKLIKAINAYFKIHYKMHEVIIRKTAKDDKRFSVYYISEDHYGRLKVLLGLD
jgi:hypothetical protein